MTDIDGLNVKLSFRQWSSWWRSHTQASLCWLVCFHGCRLRLYPCKEVSCWLLLEYVRNEAGGVHISPHVPSGTEPRRSPFNVPAGTWIYPTWRGARPKLIGKSLKTTDILYYLMCFQCKWHPHNVSSCWQVFPVCTLFLIYERTTVVELSPCTPEHPQGDWVTRLHVQHVGTGVVGPKRTTASFYIKSPSTLKAGRACLATIDKLQLVKFSLSFRLYF